MQCSQCFKRLKATHSAQTGSDLPKIIRNKHGLVTLAITCRLQRAQPAPVRCKINPKTSHQMKIASLRGRFSDCDSAVAYIYSRSGNLRFKKKTKHFYYLCSTGKNKH
uniref:Uncharacterized protein n=1 Tax=Micrurus paraensis TaxID=1970185 RepID=A0A2D4KPN4_9SAUR